MCVATGMVEVFFADLFTLKYFDVFSRQSLFGSESQNDMRSFAPFVGSGNQGEGNSPRTVTVKDPWNRNWYATWSTWCQHSEYWIHLMWYFWYLYFPGRIAIYKLDEEMQENVRQYKWYAGLSKRSTLDRTSSTLARISRDCLCCLAPALLCILSSHPEAFFRSRSLSWQVPRVSLLKGGPIQAYEFVKWNSPKSCQLQLSPLKSVCILVYRLSR